jgi:hypothetical protein
MVLWSKKIYVSVFVCLVEEMNLGIFIYSPVVGRN